MEDVSINKSIHLSEHFTLGEVTKSKHADIYNIPSHVAIENLKSVCEWLEELRFTYNALYCLKPGEDYETSENVEPIVINSGYRSPQLNPNRSLVPILFSNIKILCCPPKSQECLSLVHVSHET